MRRLGRIGFTTLVGLVAACLTGCGGDELLEQDSAAGFNGGFEVTRIAD